MKDARRVECPGCFGVDLRQIGPLQESRIFAGREMDMPLPAGSLFACQKCHLKFRSPVLSAPEYDVLYDNDVSTSWSESEKRNDWELIARYAATNVPDTATILDFGCYTGGLLARLGPRYLRNGVEVSAKAGRIASDRTGALVVPRLDLLPVGEKFDVVTAVDVVEHFSDPARFMDSLLGVTKEGGVLVVTTGDADGMLSRIMGARWWYCFFPEHLSFISERWARDWLLTSSRRGQLMTVARFRHIRLPALRYVSQAILAIFYFLAPRTYLRVLGALKSKMGRTPSVHPPGAGLSRDHIFLVIRKTGSP